MKKRVGYVEETIKSHLKVLIYETGTANEAKLMALPIDDQMQVLLMNNETILASPRLKEGLRMAGIT